MSFIDGNDDDFSYSVTHVFPTEPLKVDYSRVLEYVEEDIIIDTSHDIPFSLVELLEGTRC